VRILVLGAGFGGLELTTRLSDEFGDRVEIVLIDQSDEFVFGFSKLDVMFRRARPASVRHSYRDIVKPGVRFVHATVRSIDPHARRVETDAGSFEGDLMVVALGADLDPPATPGLIEGGHEFYTVDGAFEARDVLTRFAGGRVIIGVLSTPFKCPPAPSETALLLHQDLVERELWDQSQISLVMDFSRPIPPPLMRRRRCSRPLPPGGSSGTPSVRCASSTPPAMWRACGMAAKWPTTCSWPFRFTGRPPWSLNQG
jgi:sulfide:quinone oxidoreductase